MVSPQAVPPSIVAAVNSYMKYEKIKTCVCQWKAVLGGQIIEFWMCLVFFCKCDTHPFRENTFQISVYSCLMHAVKGTVVKIKENQTSVCQWKVVLGGQIIVWYLPNFECAWYFFVWHPCIRGKHTQINVYTSTGCLMQFSKGTTIAQTMYLLPQNSSSAVL